MQNFKNKLPFLVVLWRQLSNVNCPEGSCPITHCTIQSLTKLFINSVRILWRVARWCQKELCFHRVLKVLKIGLKSKKKEKKYLCMILF